MTPKHLYIIGPVTGKPDRNWAAFEEALYALNEAGYTCHVPHWNIPDDATWSEAMRTSITNMLQLDGVAMLDEWIFSKGAHLEYIIANELKMPARPWREWVTIAQKAAKAASGPALAFAG